MNYDETIRYLFTSLPMFQNIGPGAYKPGLQNIEAFCDSLGNPQRRFMTVHVAGTNGKGSVSHMLASVLQHAGYRTGLFTSPHLRDFRERIRVNGAMASRDFVTEFTARHRESMERLGLSFFEMTTGMAFEWFARSGADIAVIETGLGGRLDSTNILRPELSVITNIGLEHTALLGDTIAAIASEKAGIIKPRTDVVVGESHPESDPVFRAAAERLGCDIIFADRAWECVAAEPAGAGCRYTLRSSGGELRELSLDLAGDYQRRNIVTALAAAERLRRNPAIRIGEEALRGGFASAARTTGLLGRWQVIGREPLTVCDTGHNAHGLRWVAQQLEALPRRNLYMVLGVVNDKDLSRILPLMPGGAHYIFTRSSVERALPAGELCEAAARCGLRGETAPTVAAALARARELAGPEDVIFVGGSTFTVADALESLAQEPDKIRSER